ncbi:hypothetical protein GCM10027341_40400 [Spirosoma knui]
MRSFGDMLVNTYADKLGEEGTDLLKRMQSAATRMDTFIRDLLAYSRLATSERTFAPQNLNRILDEVLSDLEVSIQQKKASLSITPLPTIAGDAMQLRQLFQNLLSNALKFTQPGVLPTISIGYKQTKGSETVGLPIAGQQLSFHELVIADNGIGFDQNDVDRIFQMFQRLHSRSRYSGTGMGLAICKKIVENHKGYITAQSQPGQGARFTIFLPIN